MSSRGEDQHLSMRGHVQKRFLDDMIDCTETWKVLVLDEEATRIISSALTMYDIMERRVTIVEQLSKKRQPFPEMDVVYFISPTLESVQLILDDFPSKKKATYGAVHLFFTDSIGAGIMDALQSNSVLVSRIKTFKEMNINFLSAEANVFNFDYPDAMRRFYGDPDPEFAGVLGRKLASLCITLNEHPNIRYQQSSAFCREVAMILHQTLSQFKRQNADFVPNGEDDSGKERAQILILDRTFDTLTPLMHEYTYQAMVMDLLEVQDSLITYRATTGKGSEEKQALLNESDALWVELRHNHIAKVIETVRTRMNDIIQTSAVAKRGVGEQTITKMAAAVRELPEYQQTTSKLAQHVDIAQQCMTVFTKEKLITISNVEQTMTTGSDEEGNEVKGPKLIALIKETMQNPSIDQTLKLRLMAIFIASQRNASADEKRQLIQAAKLAGADQQLLVNLDRLSDNTTLIRAVAGGGSSSSSSSAAKQSVFSSIFKRTPVKHEATPEGQYTDTRHVGNLKILLEKLIGGDLPNDKFPSMGPSVTTSAESKSSTAKSVRKYGTNSRWGKKDQSQLSGGRYMVFVAGGVAYSELKTAHEVMQHHTKEIIIGGSHLISPTDFLVDIAEIEGETKL